MLKNYNENPQKVQEAKMLENCHQRALDAIAPIVSRFVRTGQAGAFSSIYQSLNSDLIVALMDAAPSDAAIWDDEDKAYYYLNGKQKFGPFVFEAEPRVIWSFLHLSNPGGF